MPCIFVVIRRNVRQEPASQHRHSITCGLESRVVLSPLYRITWLWAWNNAISTGMSEVCFGLSLCKLGYMYVHTDIYDLDIQESKQLKRNNMWLPWFQAAALFWLITQRVVVISYRRFGTTYRYHLRVSGI